MHIHPCELLRDAEAALIADGGVSSDALMDAAIDACCEQLRQDPAFAGAAQRFRHVVVYAGKGKNAGDAIGIARGLGFRCIHLRCAVPPQEMASETRRQLARIPAEHLHTAAEPPPPGAALIIDGLLGSGVRPPLRPEYARLVEELNTLRSVSHGALTLAVDIPTGLAADSAQLPACAVRADATLAIGCVKPGMLADGAEDFVGRLLCVPLPGLQLPPSPSRALGADTLRLLPLGKFGTL